MTKSLTLKQLSELTGAELHGDPTRQIYGVEDLEAAEVEHAAFVENKRYARKSASSKAGVIFTNIPLERDHLLHPQPSFAFQKAVEFFCEQPKSGFVGIHPTAIVEGATVGEGVTIGPFCVLDRGAIIADHTVLGPHVTVGADSKVGAFCHIHANATIREGCTLEERVVVQPGAVIGSCGFGFVTDQKGHHQKLKQLGTVIVESDVEIGANTTIDRARFKETRIKRGTKIDNLVQIAHQVELGEDNVIVAQVGIAGSTKTGRHVVLGGQTGVAGHIEITDGVQVAACSAVSKTLKESGTYYGTPAMIDHEFKEHFMALRGLKRLLKRVKALEEGCDR
ncbi:MAG: UDP-3-O-acylglucosamine N-acyltransferase [Chlamydiales bacterium]|nr:UDP-3-O-acylglucosamine N-acyltransferase [Chlamydiales bacterium]MCH9636134.1 UDP-3-O-acylglucosamine N-acyltransferase [Chlamydiales bacterium]MCH9703411.1 UDP-3-O-(3-hydroxymyristoyl)glucosamine N-acyltransferase [Chlamydiota bacterium]